MTTMTREEFIQKFGREPSRSTTTQQATTKEPQTQGFANQLTDALGLKGATDLVGATIANVGARPQDKKYVEYPTGKEALGAGITGLTYALAPGTSPGAGLLTQAGTGAVAGYGFDVGSKLQQNKSFSESLTPGVGTLIGAALPPAVRAGGVVTRMFGNLFKGVGSGLSGASVGQIEAILTNPRAAAEVSRQIAQSGEQAIVQQNARKIVNGVVSARQQARQVYGSELEKLSTQDIKPDVFRSGTQAFLDKYGISLESGTGVRTLQNVEFEDPKNLQKASDLIDRLATVDLDGRSLRKLMDDIDSAQYKTATSDERLSFNAFLRDMEGAVRKSIDASTPKLREMNAKFSKDMQLLDAAQAIFGRVEYGNLEETLKASQRLENLFKQKGMAPSVIDDFLTRIGLDSGEFRSGEAARQMGNIEQSGNAPGLNPFELMRSFTSTVVSPQMVRDVTIATGASENVVKSFLEAISPQLRNVVIQALIPNQSESQTTSPQTLPTPEGI